MSEIEEFVKFHPRAVKLLRKKKPFLVIAEDEPYYLQVYALVRSEEQRIGRWTSEDERAYQAAQHPR